MIIQAGKKETLHVYAVDGSDIEKQVIEVLNKESITPKTIRKDRNNELFLLFPSEAKNDEALEILTTSGEFKDEEGHFIKVGQATDNVLETVLKTIIQDTQQQNQNSSPWGML